MAKFKCKYSNGIYEFTFEHDIKSMREHSDYEEVAEDTPAAKEETKPSKKVAKDGSKQQEQ